MPLGLGSGLFAVVLPVEKTNLVQNPSAELGTTYWGTSTNGAIGTSSAFQQFGAWSFSCTPTAATTDGIRGGSVPLIDGPYAVSAYIRGAAGVVYNLEIAPAPTGNALGSGTFTGGGTWQYVTFGYTEAGGGGGTITRAVVVRKRNDTSVAPFYVDGVQVEAGSVTTYFDGDTGGGTWQGAPHASTSFRSGQYRGGGSVIALADLGLQVDQMPGVGMPPIESSAQSYAIIDGAQFQRQRTAQRSFTLTAKPINGTTLADFHATRRTLIDAFKPDLVTPQQPVRLLYVGGQGTQQIDAYYASGLELGNMQGPIAEDAAIGFTAYDPYWYRPTQEGTTLVPRVALGSVNYIARRSPLGAWGTLGVAGTTIKASGISITSIRSLAINAGGTVFLGGWFGSVGGTLSPNIGMYFPTTNRFGTLTGGTTDQAAGQLLGLTFNPGGTLFLCGQWNTIAGTSTNHVARWNGAYGSLVGGTLSNANFAWTVFYSPLGSLFVGGDITSVAGTANATGVAFWNGATWGTLGGTLGAAQVQSFAWGLDNGLYIGGIFSQVQGTVGTAVARWKGGALGTLQNPLGRDATNAGEITQLSIGPDGRLWEAGRINTIASGSARGAAVWNGVSQSGLGSGFGFQSGYNASSESWCVLADGSTGNVYYGGVFSQVGGINTPANYTVWNGYTFLLPDISFISAGMTLGTVYDLARSSDGAIYIAGNFVGTAQAASVGTIVNTGRSQVYPTLRMRNTGATGTARIYQLLNTTTGAGIYFNLTLLPGEQATLNLTPGARSFQSDAQGNVFNSILPGSNLATWALQSGTNYVSFFSDNDSLEAAFYWQPKAWSIDGGTVN